MRRSQSLPLFLNIRYDLTDMLITALCLAVLMGLVLGLLGGGGSLLTVPILVYVLQLDPKSAIAASLAVVGATAVVGLTSHARAGNVAWRVGVLFAPTAMLGSYLGGLVAKYIAGPILLLLFAVLVFVTSVAMLRGKKQYAPKDGGNLLLFAIEGLIVGGVTGLVGAGGGFLIVPALVIFGGVPMKQAVGTSLLIIAMKSVTGVAGYMGHIDIPWAIVAQVVGCAAAGTIVGAALAKRIDASKLRKGFGVFTLLMGIAILARELSPMLQS